MSTPITERSVFDVLEPTAERSVIYRETPSDLLARLDAALREVREHRARVSTTDRGAR